LKKALKVYKQRVGGHGDQGVSKTPGRGSIPRRPAKDYNMKKEKTPLEKGTERVSFIKQNAENIARLIDKANGTPSKFLVKDLLAASKAIREDVTALIDEQLFE